MADKEMILAIVTTNQDDVSSGNATIFHADNSDTQQMLAQEIGRALRGDVIKLSNGCLLIIQK